jgi:uncharacterized protein involved in exopolysaccharide biosynthesis
MEEGTDRTVELEQDIRPAALDKLYAASPDQPADSRSDAQLAFLLWARRGYIAKFTVAGVLVGLLLTFILPKKYEATARIVPPESSALGLGAMAAMMTGGSGGGGGGGAVGDAAMDLLGASKNGLYVAMLKSRTVQDRLVERFHLKQVYHTKLMQSAAKKLEKRTTVTDDRKTGVLSVDVEDHDPDRVLAIARGYVEEVDRLSAEVNASSAHRERVFLEQRLVTVKQDLDKAERDFSDFASKNDAINVPQQAIATVMAEAQLQGELIAAESELKGVEQIYTDNNVRVRTLEARVGELHRKLAEVGGQEDDPDPIFPSLRKLPILGVTYADLYRRSKIEEIVYATLTKKYELAKVEEAKQSASIRVIEEPRRPEKPFFPTKGLFMSIFGFLGFAGAIGLVAGQRAWEQKSDLSPAKQWVAMARRDLRRDLRFRRRKPGE